MNSGAVIETSLGFNLTGRQGYPIPYIARVSTSEGSQPVLISDEIDNHRLPNITVLDLRLAKDVRLGPVGLTVSADVFNVFNRNTELQRNVANSSGTNTQQNRISELLSPRAALRLGFRCWPPRLASLPACRTSSSASWTSACA